jgi:phage FluMu gp28-like protein
MNQSPAPQQSNRVRLPALHTAQRQVVARAARWNVLACGRRWGKSTLGIDRLIQPALYGDPVAWCSPTYKMLLEIWRSVRQTLQPLTVRSVQADHRIELRTGGVVEMWSLEHPDALRGRKYRRVVIDEAAMVRELAYVWQQVLRPALADLGGDAWLLSTPRGHDYFWRCFRNGQEGLPGWRSWQMPSGSNPFLDPAEIDAARRELPEQVFRQEFLAVFLDQAGAVFRRVQEAATATPQEEALPGHSYVMGVDWGRQADYTCLAVIDTTTRELVALDRFNQIDYQVQLGRLHALARRFAPLVIVAEQNSIGLPLIEQLQRDGLPVSPFVTSNASKMRMIDALALAFEQGTLQILPDPVLLAELHAFEMERLPSGLVRYAAPPGQHDDCCIALALAHQATLESGPLVLW